MQVPINKETFEGEIATYWFEDGILVSLSKSPKRTVANITDNVALVKRITNNKPVPLLIYLSNSPVPDKETRKFNRTTASYLFSNGNGFQTRPVKVHYEYSVRAKASAHPHEKLY
jgi:hypothetical protein